MRDRVEIFIEVSALFGFLILVGGPMLYKLFEALRRWKREKVELKRSRLQIARLKLKLIREAVATAKVIGASKSQLEVLRGHLLHEMLKGMSKPLQQGSDITISPNRTKQRSHSKGE